MKPNTEANVAVLSRGVEDTITMRIDEAAMGHIMDQLINLYTNQRLAVVREYSTNARDAMIEAGRGHLPIEVTTPSYESPYLTIKDTGLGMSYEDMRDTYAAYGTSTKRASDAVNGMLGFGSKSGLTYAQQFQVIGVKDGVKIQALVAKNEDGVGTIEIMSERETDEPNGVTVKIPVPAGDFHRIADTCDDFYQYWAPGTVLVNGEQPIPFRERAWGDNFVWLDEWTCVRLDGYRRGDHVVIMGDVAYPIKLPNLQLDVHVTAWVNMGDVAFTPSREGLKDNEKRTVQTATELAAYVDERLPKVMLDRINALDLTPWARYEMIYKWNNFLPRALRQQSFIEIPAGRQAWKLGGSYDVERRAERQNPNYLLSSLSSGPHIHVIVDYPHNNVSGSIKRRLAKMTTGGSRTQWVLLPNGTDVSILTGRDNLFTFDQLPEADKADRSQREKREGAYKYTVHLYGGTWEDVEKVEQKSGTPLFFGTPDKGRWSNNQENYKSYAKQLQGDYVELTPRQVDKFVRLHPWAQEVTEAYQKARAAAEVAVTEVDREARWLNVNAMSHGFQSFAEIVDRIDDPDLVAAIKAATNEYTSPTLAAAERFGVYIGEPAQEPDMDFGAIVKRYPLLTFDRYGRTMSPERIEDSVVYINAKFATLP